MEYLRDEPGRERCPPPDRERGGRPVSGLAALTARASPRSRRIPWTAFAARLSAGWLALTVVVLPGVLLLGQTMPSEGQIAYTTRRGVEEDISMMDVRTRLAYTVLSQFNLDQMVWSSQGGFAFLLRRAERTGLAVVDLQRGEVRRLTSGYGFVNSPAWSPDGQWITFQSSYAGDAEIYIIQPDGESMRQITDNEDYDGDPSWSPDGQQLVFRSNRDGPGDLYVTDLQETNVRRLTTSEAWEEHPAWSPDGGSIVYAAYGLNNWDLFLLDLASGQINQLTDSPARDHYPTWSPDGTRIAFESDRGGQAGIYVMALADGSITRLSQGLQGSYYPTWQP